MGMDGQRHAPAALPPWKRLGTHCIGGWVASGSYWTVAEDLAFAGVKIPDRPAGSVVAIPTELSRPSLCATRNECLRVVLMKFSAHCLNRISSCFTFSFFLGMAWSILYCCVRWGSASASNGFFSYPQFHNLQMAARIKTSYCCYNCMNVIAVM